MNRIDIGHNGAVPTRVAPWRPGSAPRAPRAPRASRARMALMLLVVVGLATWALWRSPSGPTPTTAIAAPVSAPTAAALRAVKARDAAAQYLQFEPNRGQAAKAVRYVSRGPRHSVEVFDDGIALAALSATGRAGAPTVPEPASITTASTTARAQLRFVGAHAGGRFEEREPAPGQASYLVGADASRWVRGVPRFRQLRYAGLYPGIDLVYYSRQGELEFDLVVQPGADASRVRLHVGGANAPAIADNGDLLLDGANGVLRLHRPVLYQNIHGQKKVLDGRYVLDGARELSFALPEYDKRHPLVIDPVFKLLYSTLLGGVHDDQVGAMALDAQGNAYVAGQSGSEDWPVSGNAWQATRKNLGRYVRNLVVTKFDASGTLIYSTFIGGSVNDYATGIAVDAAGNAYITGSTNSPDFPVTAGAAQSTFKGAGSAYLAVLSPDGSALRHSTFFGGTGSAEAQAIALDANGAPVLAGTAGPGLPTTAGAYKATLATGRAAFVARFSPLAQGAPQLVAASYYGVDNPQANASTQGNTALGMALDASGAAWITGQAFTTNLPTTSAALQAAPTAMSASCAAGPAPLNSFAYVARLSADLGTLGYASYVSGKSEAVGASACAEFSRSVALDAAGNVYLAGGTASATFPVTAGALQSSLPIGNDFGSYSGFVSKLSPDGRTLLWSTYFGGNVGSTFPGASLVAHAGTGSLWMTVVTGGGSNYPVTGDALQPALGGGTDAGVVQFNATTGALTYSTFLGGSGNDAGLAMAVDASGNAFVAGATTSANFPVTANAFQPKVTAGAYDGSDWFFSIVGSGTIGTVSRSTAGNAGDATVFVSASGVTAGAVGRLVSADGGTTLTARGVATADALGRWPFTFALDGVATGAYDLVVRNADGSEVRKTAALTVSAGQGPKLSMAIVGRAAVRIGTPAKYQLTVTNSGDTDAYYAVVRVGLPAAVQAKFGFGPSVPQFAGDTTDYNANTATAVQAGVAYTLVYFPVVPVGTSASVDVDLTATDGTPINLEAILLPSYLPSIDALKRAVGLLQADRSHALGLLGSDRSHGLPAGLSQPLAAGRAQPLLTRQQASKCASDVILLVAAAAATASGLGAAGAVGASMAVLTGVVASSLVNGPQGQSMQGQGYEAAQNAAQSFLPNAMQNIAGAFNIVNDCDPDGSLRDRLLHAITPHASIDPNDKTGPAGDGSAAHFVRSTAALPYQIAFENQATAGLAAAQVVVTDQLDTRKFDLASVSLGSIAFGTHRISVPAGLKSYATVYNIDTTMSVRVQGSLDSGTGVLKWTFTTIDPVTRLAPSDPTLGFLPPDTDGVKGQGYVSFTVAPKAGLPEGTAWSNQALIVFDANAPINTPTFVNTLDTTAPLGRVASATQKSASNDVDVAWGASDSGSGTRSYTVFVADNGGPYTPWQAGVASTSAVFPGTLGHSYGFYVIATDGAGNTEAPKSAAEASVTVAAAPAAGNGSSGGGGGCTIGGAGQRDASLVLLMLAALTLLRRNFRCRVVPSSRRTAPR